MTSKYQATIPKNIRAKLGLEAGDRILFEEQDGMVTISKIEATDWQYLEAISLTLDPEWSSSSDEKAYANL